MDTTDMIMLQLNKYKDTALLIGSANYPFKDVFKSRVYPFDLNAAEYVVGQRLFPGCDILDEIELKGEKLSKEFLQLGDNYKSLLCLYSGTQANQVVYNAILKPYDKVLVFSEKSGGHPSHISFLKKYYKVIEYNFNFEDGISYNDLGALIEKYTPRLLIAGSTLYPESINYALLREICKGTGTLLLADISHFALYVATGAHGKVRDYADFITYTTHKTTRGIRSAVLHYKKEYEKEILESLCSVTQGAPKYSDILANTIMFENLQNVNLIEYQSRIFDCANRFISIANKFNFKTIGTGNSHMVLIDFSDSSTNSNQIRKLLESNNIYVTNHGKYLRVGFMSLATLQMSIEDQSLLYTLMLTIISKGTDSQINIAEDIKRLMNKYTYNFYKENYDL